MHKWNIINSHNKYQPASGMHMDFLLACRNGWTLIYWESWLENNLCWLTKRTFQSHQCLIYDLQLICPSCWERYQLQNIRLKLQWYQWLQPKVKLWRQMVIASSLLPHLKFLHAHNFPLEVINRMPDIQNPINLTKEVFIVKWKNFKVLL